MEQRIDYLFPTPVLLSSVDKDVCSKYSKLILSLVDTDKLKLPNLFSLTTTDDLHNREDFSELYKTIDDISQYFFRETIGLVDGSLKMTGMWCNVQKSGCVHPVHQHPNSYYSGVLYLNVPEPEHEFDDCGDIVFNDPRPTKCMQQGDFFKGSVFSDRAWKYNSRTGTMILFPSWFEHGTRRFINLAGGHRMALSFNYFLTKCHNTETMKYSV